jgi:hypothetical protein
MDNDAPPTLLVFGDETDAGLCVDGVCAVPSRPAAGTDVTDVTNVEVTGED